MAKVTALAAGSMATQSQLVSQGILHGVSFNVYKDSKKVTLLVGNPNLSLKLNKEVAKVLGLPKTRLTPLLIYKGIYNVSPHNSMLVHCRELNKSKNFYNGHESDLLSVINVSESQRDKGIQFCDATAKTLKNDQIDTLTFSLRDAYGNPFNNRRVPVTLVCDIVSI